jgi:hypothetical protein
MINRHKECKIATFSNCDIRDRNIKSLNQLQSALYQYHAI